MKIIINVRDFFVSIIKLLFTGICSIPVIAYNVFYHFIYGLWVVLKLIFGWPLMLTKSNKNKQKVKNNVNNELIKPKVIVNNSELKKAKALKSPSQIDNKKEVLSMNFQEADVAKSDKKQTYIYEAKDKDGKFVKGKFDAYSKVDVHSFLLNEGYEVYSIKTSSWINFLYGSSSIASDKYSKKELIFFLTQLSTYIRSGIPLIDSIRIFCKQEQKSSKQKILQSIVYELVMGESFSNALDKQGKTFPRLLINMVKTAEMTGELPETLDDMANYYTTLEKTRKQMISAMMYPSIIFVMSIAIMTFIMIWVVPQFIDIYGDIGADIPDITKFVINISNFMGKYYIYLFGGIAIVIILFVYLYKKIKLFRKTLQYITMHIPVFGKIIIYNEVTTFTKTFGSLLNHNVFITDSMDILSKITNNEIYKDIIFATMDNLSRGEGISVAFKNQWAFPVVAYEMLLTGERTGELGKMMNKVSDFYQEQHSALITQMKSFIEPIMIAVLAFLVGGLLLAVVIPMFSLYNQI